MAICMAEHCSGPASCQEYFKNTISNAKCTMRGLHPSAHSKPRIRHHILLADRFNAEDINKLHSLLSTTSMHCHQTQDYGISL